MERNSPTSIFDINYWGEDLISKLDIKRIENKVFECVKLNKGYYIRLQKEPLDILNAEHVENQKEINELLGFLL